MTDTVEVLLQHNSGQFSDTKKHHTLDFGTIFDHAVDSSAWSVSGTEGANTPKDQTLRERLRAAAVKRDFVINASEYGDWVAFNKRFFKEITRDYIGPLIPATHGLSAAQGGHNGRGLALLTGTSKDHDLGDITVASAHFLTERSTRVSGSNDPLIHGIGAYGREFGAHSDICFVCADANLRDDEVDVFKGEPFTTIADELSEYFKTHGLNKRRGSAIDIIASYDSDRRVKAKKYEVLDDSDLHLFTDHFILQATYEVKVRAA